MSVDHLPRALLRGRDHPELGEVAVEGVGERLAVALTRGDVAKGYAYVDPNEDVTAAVGGVGADLLVVADGHNGCPAAEAALDVVLERLGDRPPPPGLQERQVVELFWEANEAVRAATAGLGSPRGSSRTTLTVCLVGADRLQWAAMGDSPLIVVDGEGGRELTRGRHQFLGDAVSAPELAGRMTWGSAEIDPGGWVLALTDGFSNFAPPAGDPVAAAIEALTGVEGPVPGARALLARAGEGGAGDNVAVALRAPAG